MRILRHKKSKNISLLLSFCFVFLASCGGSSGGSSDNSSSNTTPAVPTPTSIQGVLDQAVSSGIDGIFVYIDQTNQVDESYAAGIENKLTQQAANAESLFKIASISKLFIAVSAAKLAVKEQISINDTLASWLPELADRVENSDIITISHLIQHRSGIADFDSQAGFDWQNAHTDIDSTLLFALDKPSDFQPNSRYEYSNTNYLLLAKILDRALGYSHHVFISENILIPLGMHDTYAQLGDIDSARLAKGYWGGIERSTQDYVIPGGSMISTVKDIALFIRALNTGSLLTPEERELYGTVYWFNHSGWLPGYQSVANYESSIDAVVIQFINTTGGSSESIANSTYQNLINQLN
ncbi:serine hydrolase domain-containing protein [Thalassotalea atypica]|uniref:serine hydrolase domain-containing protein n=1 Tax=Thalassotalea atypica TaxID=2054316 RepID=UPI00257361A5|nr:serine hydrolase domain-containing protein [Thalassotalea atypica]